MQRFELLRDAITTADKLEFDGIIGSGKPVCIKGVLAVSRRLFQKNFHVLSCFNSTACVEQKKERGGQAALLLFLGPAGAIITIKGVSGRISYETYYENKAVLKACFK